MCHTLGSYSDTLHMTHFSFDLDEGAMVYGGKAFKACFREDVLREPGQIALMPLHRKYSKRRFSAWVEYVQHHYRKGIETAVSLIGRLLPKTIHAVTARGFELKVFLFVLAFSIDGLL